MLDSPNVLFLFKLIFFIKPCSNCFKFKWPNTTIPKAHVFLVLTEVGEEGDAETSSARYDTERLGGAFDGDTGKKRFSVPLCKELGIGNDDFKYKITLGPKQHEVMDVSAELLELLGYPKVSEQIVIPD